MGVIDSIKDTARKTSNKVVDTTEEIIGIRKSPQEIAKRIVEHLSHGEYKNIAAIISEETRKNASKMGIDDLAPINNKLDEFEASMNDLAENLEEGNYQQTASKLKEIERSIPDKLGSSQEISEMFKMIKRFLDSIIKTLEEYSVNDSAGKQRREESSKRKPDFSKLEKDFVRYFTQLTKPQ
jgi:hypothetical protein